MYGGLNDNSSSGYNEGSGQVGLIDVNFQYTVGVNVAGDRIEVTDDQTNLSNVGTLTALSGQTAGFVGNGVNDSLFSFFDKGDNNDLSFIFDNDGHRLNGHPAYDPTTTYVGRGWVDFDGASGSPRDFLFTATLVPEPSSLLIWAGAGLAFAGIRRRNK